jgi:hypothetical protein
MTDRKKPGVAFWASVVVAVLIYPLSFGPACWICTRSPMVEIWDFPDRAYQPILWAWKEGPKPMRNAIK